MLLLILLACAHEPDGAALYADYCGLCHGYAGEGYLADRANALANPDFLAIADDAFLLDSTARGRSGTSMTSWATSEGGPLEDEEIGAIVEVVRAWQTADSVVLDPAPIDGDAEAGAARYASDCASCHGEDGEGDSALSLSSPEFLEVVLDDYLWESIATGRRGTAMPGYAETLEAEDIDDLVAFIRSWEE